MESSGIGLSVWVTLAGIVVVFFVLPGAYLEFDRRRTLRRARAAGEPAAAGDERPQPAARG